MWFEQLLGSSMFVGALAALVQTIRLAIPDVSKAFASRAEARLAEINAIVVASSDLRSRLDQCDAAHKERDERDRLRDEAARRNDLEHARELGYLRGLVARLRDEVSVLRSAPGPKSPEGQV
jgi:hypothetical protein